MAREVGATQPAISRQVAALEEHLGARLLQRSTRSLTLTEDGRELLTHARLVLDAVAQAEAAITRQRALVEGARDATDAVRRGQPTTGSAFAGGAVHDRDSGGQDGGGEAAGEAPALPVYDVEEWSDER